MEFIVTKDNFAQEVLDAKTPVLVDFWADWCMPCRMMDPVLKEIAESYEGKLKVAKVNVDENSELASEYGIVSIPTLLFFKEGGEAERIVGAVPRDKIEVTLKAHIN